MRELITLNGAIRARLDKEFRAKQFTPSDFYDIADRMGMSHKNITGALRRFELRGLLEVVRRTSNANGGEPAKTYRIVKGADLAIQKSSQRVKEHRARVKAHEKQMMAACKRLNNVVEGWWGKERKLREESECAS